MMLRQPSSAGMITVVAVPALFWLSTPPLPCHAFHSIAPSRPRIKQPLYSTPFEADFYDNPYDDVVGDDNGRSSSSTVVSPETKLVLGINKYSHDTSLCAADARSGHVLFALSKERLSRRKHDGGNAATLVDACLSSLQLDLDAVETVVMNNHHHRILPYEQNTRHLEWECGLLINGGTESGYNEDENLFPNVTDKLELSHHLAHAYSTACQAPFDTGLVVVMDGMGETYRTMMRAVETNDTTYVSDLTINGSKGVIMDKCLFIPSDLHQQSQTSYFDWREAESVYTFEKQATSGSSSVPSPRITITPIFKRFTPENSPPVLYNHGFENMDSVGALYSRASSHIFGDWNACGKVMGLSPWACHSWVDDDGLKIQPPIDDVDDDNENHAILAGSLYDESHEKRLRINRHDLQGMPFVARNDPDLFEEATLGGSIRRKKRYDFDDNDSSDVTAASTVQSTDEDDDDNAQKTGRRLPTKVALDAIALAHKIQTNLETVSMDLVRHFQKQTKARNLCLAGGVALNSVLNGRLARELGFEKTFISPYPGDDGIAIGCCAYGLFGRANNPLQRKNNNAPSPPIWTGSLSPYLGPDPSEYDIKHALDQAAPWLEVEAIRNENARLQIMVDEIESGGVVAWYRSRSEMGPRALGHRSILADPRKKGLVRFINENVKSRESFRPFAPSVLAEHAHEWFHLGNDDENENKNNASPFMSMTAMVHEDKRPRIPAVTHVDGSSRLQTVTREAEPVYHKIISKFHEKTGVPMILNTSFNTLPSEPIVESPTDAVRSFLYSMGSIEMLVMGDYVVRRKEANLRKLLGEATKEGGLKMEPACPRRTGAVTFESSFSLNDGPTDEDEVETVTKIRMPDRPMHMDGSKNEWFELLDELEEELLSICDGTVTMNEIMAQYTAVPEDQEGQQPEKEAADEAQTLVQNIVHRLVRLYEHTFISW